MAVTAEQIADIAASCLSNLDRMRWHDIAYDLQDYIAMRQILTDEKVTEESGKNITVRVMTEQSGAARNVQLGEKDVVVIKDLMTSGSVPWRHTTTNYGWFRQEFAMNRPGPNQVYKLVTSRRIEGLMSLALRHEVDFWNKPDDSTDTLKPFGIDYWLVTDTSEGFNGGNPSGFSAGAAGLDVATYDGWNNYTDQYASVSFNDLVDKIRRALTFCNFRNPVAYPDAERGSKDRFGIYSRYSVIGALENLAREQNDELGNDLASKDGRVTIRGVPLVWVPQLENDSSYKVYGINWRWFSPVFLQGENMNESKPRVTGDSHTTITVHIDNTFNYVCRNRRGQFVLTL